MPCPIVICVFRRRATKTHLLASSEAQEEPGTSASVPALGPSLIESLPRTGKGQPASRRDDNEQPGIDSRYEGRTITGCPTEEGLGGDMGGKQDSAIRSAMRAFQSRQAQISTVKDGFNCQALRDLQTPVSRASSMQQSMGLKQDAGFNVDCAPYLDQVQLR